MAITTLTNAQVLVNGVDLSDHVSKVTVDRHRDSVDITAMGATNKTITKGLGDASIRSTSSRTSPRQGPRDAAAADRVVDAGRGRGAAGQRGTVGDEPGDPADGALLMNYSGLDGSVGQASSITAEFVNGVPGRHDIPDRVGGVRRRSQCVGAPRGSACVPEMEKDTAKEMLRAAG
jgi:hypothetical protein